MSNNIVLSIIIVNYNTKDLLKECINSIHSNSPTYSYEIIVVDNNSNDGSKDFLSGNSNIITVFNRENLGFSRANNIGIQKSKGDYILLLNSDTRILQNSLDKMIEYMDNNPVVGILGPELVGENGEIVHMSWDFIPTIFWENVRKFFSPKNIKRYRIIQILVKLLQRNIRYVPVLSGASMFIRKKVFNQVGLLDENFFLYFEEPDFCKRVRENNWKVVFFPESKIVHLLGKSMNTVGSVTETYYRKSQLYYYRKHRPWIEQVFLRYYLLLKYKVKSLFANNVRKANYEEIISTIKKW